MGEQEQVVDSQVTTEETTLEEKIFDNTDVKAEEQTPEVVEETKESVEPEVEAEEEQTEVSEEEEEFELSLPEDSYLQESDMESMLDFAKEHDLTPDQAQAVLDAKEHVYKSFADAQAQQSVDWEKELRIDSELGGEHFTAVADRSRKVIQKFGSEKLITQLNESGYGNHPELVRLLNRIGQAMSNDSLTLPSTFSSEPKSMEEIFYGQQT